MFFPTRKLLAFAGALGVAAATAQPSAPSPSQSVPAYRSAFEDYRPYTDAPAVPWREANDSVGRIGGWRAYAREAQAPASAASGNGRGHAK